MLQRLLPSNLYGNILRVIAFGHSVYITSTAKKENFGLFIWTTIPRLHEKHLSELKNGVRVSLTGK